MEKVECRSVNDTESHVYLSEEDKLFCVPCFDDENKTIELESRHMRTYGYRCPECGSNYSYKRKTRRKMTGKLNGDTRTMLKKYKDKINIFTILRNKSTYSLIMTSRVIPPHRDYMFSYLLFETMFMLTFEDTSTKCYKY